VPNAASLGRRPTLRRDCENTDRARKGSEELHESSRRLVPSDPKREGKTDFAVRWVEIESLVVRCSDVLNALGLQPKRRAR
jgi:hypothetical protein